MHRMCSPRKNSLLFPTKSSGFSGHSSRNELMAFVSNLSPKPRKIILNHGEQSRSIDLASSIHKSYRIETLVPKNLEAVRLR